jgi:hypothetical protein
MRMLAACLMLMLPVGCMTNGAVDTKCLTEQAVRLTDAEIAALSPETARQILANDEDGARRCHWKPGKGG